MQANTNRYAFEMADTAEPYYELMYLPFGKSATKPCFKQTEKTPKIDKQGFILYYSHQCPFTAIKARY